MQANFTFSSVKVETNIKFFQFLGAGQPGRGDKVKRKDSSAWKIDIKFDNRETGSCQHDTDKKQNKQQN